MSVGSARVKFLLAWAALLVAKLVLAARLPLFGDEAFYAWEARHLAWAYSDLPGLTAWLARLGLAVGGDSELALRLPFVLLGATLPWLVRRCAARAFGEAAGWQAAWLALLMPLAGLMGVLALPDVPMLVAAMLVLDAVLAMLARRRAADVLQLALGLAMGALAHYRFAAVILAGLAGLLCFPAGRALLREGRTWAALATGALAWLPLLQWNLAHAGAGVGFQLVDRHPWTPGVHGFAWPPLQLLLVTPPLCLLLLAVLRRAWRRRGDPQPAWPLLLGAGGVASLGWFALAFVADVERVSFHWPIAGWLALCVAAPVELATWPRAARVVVHATAATGLVLLLGWLALVARVDGRAWLAHTPAYPENFAGWDTAADATREALRALPPGTRVVADNFMLAAQLGWALGGRDIEVAPHPRNAKHGRAVQLADWGVLRDARGDGPVLLVVEDTARPAKDRLAGYRGLCDWAGGLAPPQVVPADGGRKRFLLYPQAAPPAPGCALPALGWIETPAPGAHAGDPLEVQGWALVPGGRVAAVELQLDGRMIARAVPGLARPDVIDYWGLAGQDDRVGFALEADAGGRGRARLGLVVVRDDGRREALPTQLVVLR